MSPSRRGALALTPLLVFLLVYLVTSLAVGDFYKVPVSAASRIGRLPDSLHLRYLHHEQRRRSSCEQSRGSSCEQRRRSNCEQRRGNNCEQRRRSSCEQRRGSSCEQSHGSNCEQRRGSSGGHMGRETAAAGAHCHFFGRGGR